MHLSTSFHPSRPVPVARPLFAIAVTVALCAGSYAAPSVGQPPLGAQALSTLDVSPALAGSLAYVSSHTVYGDPSAATTTLSVAEYGIPQFLGYAAAAPGEVHATAIATQSIHTLIRELSGKALARTDSTWEVNSELAPGTPLWVQMELSFHGTVALAADALTGQLGGAAAATFTAASPGGGRSLYSDTGSLSAASAAGSLALQTAGFWSDALAGHTLATTFQLQFIVPSDSLVLTTLELALTTHSLGGRSGSLSMDFGNTGTFAFVGATDLAGHPVEATFQLVPEPGTFLFGGLASLLLRRRR